MIILPILTASLTHFSFPLSFFPPFIHSFIHSFIPSLYSFNRWKTKGMHFLPFYKTCAWIPHNLSQSSVAWRRLFALVSACFGCFQVKYQQPLVQNILPFSNRRTNIHAYNSGLCMGRGGGGREGSWCLNEGAVSLFEKKNGWSASECPT